MPFIKSEKRNSPQNIPRASRTKSFMPQKLDIGISTAELTPRDIKQEEISNIKLLTSSP